MRTKRHRPKTSIPGHHHHHLGHATRRSISIMFARRIFCWSTCDVFSFCLCVVLIVTVISITRDQGTRQQHYQMMLRVSAIKGQPIGIKGAELDTLS